MKLTRLSLLAALLIYSLVLRAQTSTIEPGKFDILTYQPPKGWESNVNDDAIWHQTTDNKTGAWCQVGIFKAVRTSGDPAKDFESEWKALVNPANYVGALLPTPTAVEKDGWTSNVGTSKFTWEGKDATLMLMTRSGYGVLVSVITTMNTDRFMKEALDVLGSIIIDKTAGQQLQQQQQPGMSITATSAYPPITVTDAPGVHGIATSTTNFNDGWVSQPFADYVKVTKGPISVLLHYGLQIDDQMRNGDMALVLWNRLIGPRYESGLLKIFENEPYTYNKIYFIEGEAVEHTTRKKSYVCLRVLVANGIAHCIEIISPSDTAYESEFPNQEKIAAMTGYNKFFVVASDIEGTWEESSSTGINMYNTTTGAYAGMNTSASANSFTFKSDGTYDSNHKGAYGMVGSMKFYDQKYHGKYTMGQWEVTMTNRFEGKTDVYYCEYEAVRGGRMLKLTDKSASAITYRLVKVK